MVLLSLRRVVHWLLVVHLVHVGLVVHAGLLLARPGPIITGLVHLVTHIYLSNFSGVIDWIADIT